MRRWRCGGGGRCCSGDGSESEGGNGGCGSSLCHKLPLPMWERARFGLLWGLSLHLQDFEKYMLYFLLTRSSGCGFVSLYGVYLLVANALSIPMTMLAGWLTDFTRSFQHRVLQVAAVVMLAFLPLEVFFATRGEWWGAVLMQVAYQIRQLAIYQAMCSVWKLLKIRMDAEKASTTLGEETGLVDGTSKMKNLENEVNNWCGNLGDISCELFTLICLSVIVGLEPSFSACFIITTAWVLALSVCYVLLALSIRTIAPLPLVNKPTTSKEEEKESEPAAATPAEGVEGDASHSSSPPLPLTRPKTTPAEKCGSFWGGLARRFRYLGQARIVREVLPHALGMWLLYILVTYPVTVFSAFEDNSEASYSDAGTEEDMCHGSLLQLDLQGLVINAMYLVTSTLYKLFIVPCRPRTYFSWVYPVLASVSGACVLLLLLGVADKVRWVYVFLVALAQVLPYYFQGYDFYLLNTSTDEALLGFVLSVIWLGQQSLNLTMSLLLALEVHIDILFISCLVLIVFFVTQSFFLVRLFKAKSWTAPSATEEAQLLPADAAEDVSVPVATDEQSGLQQRRQPLEVAADGEIGDSATDL